MLVAFWGTTLFAITFLYLFVCVDGNSGGVLATMKNFLFDTLPELLRAVMRRICGEWFAESIDGFSKYLCYSQNPIVQVIYLLAAGGGFVIYVLYGFCHMPGPYVSGYHKYTGTVLMLACYYSYYRACKQDPGYITSQSRKQA